MTAGVKMGKCPKCGAHGGTACVTVGGRVAEKVHYGRTDEVNYRDAQNYLLSLPDEQRREIVARRARQGRWLISGTRVES